MINPDFEISNSRILVIDDLADNVRFLEALLASAKYTNVVTTMDSGSAMEMIASHPPDLVLLDLHMPQPDGYEILRQLRGRADRSDYLPVLVFTADGTMAAKTKALGAGASDFLTKPADATEILLRVRNFLEARRMHVQLRMHRARLEEQVLERTLELSAAHRGALEGLARAAEFRDDSTGGHIKRVAELSGKIAARLGHPSEAVEAIQLAAPLHDVGKIAIPDAILLKPGRLTETEMATMKKHTIVGAEMLSAIDSSLMRLARDIALSHHERWDGSGYPNGKVGDDIPIAGQIVSVADVYDALIQVRPYKLAWPKRTAVDEISRQRGRQFGPLVVDAFLKVVNRV